LEYDVAVIGGGPGGYVAAIRAAQLGAKVLLIEKEKLGGVCLNRGCIPTKTLLKSAEKWQDLKHCADFGLKAENISFDFAAVMDRKNQVVSRLQAGIMQLLKSNDIEVVYGEAKLAGNSLINVLQPDGEVSFEAKKIILAVGSKAMQLPIIRNDLPGVIDSDQLLALEKVPQSMVVVGAGAVGIEFASILQAFGCEVSIVEMLPTILPTLDADLIKRMGLLLRKSGIKTYVGTKLSNVRGAAGRLEVTVENGAGTQVIVTDNVLVAGGRRPLVDGIGLETTGIEYSRKGIAVNASMETTVKGIYAIGDLTGSYMLAHAASAEGMVAAENAMGGDAVMDYRAVPGCIFTSPELAFVGLTEQEALSQGMEVKSSIFNFAANCKAISMGETDGLVKIVADGVSGKIIGMHIMGPHASDLIMEGVIAIQNGLTAKDIAHCIHPHPSLSETVMESAHGVYGDIIHQAKLKMRK